MNRISSLVIQRVYQEGVTKPSPETDEAVTPWL